MQNLNTWQRIRGHLRTINQHKLKVMSLCFQVHLYKQGLKHDLSKYSWTELKTGFKYYQGYRSPIDAQKENENGVSFSWLHHKGRNPHHWEFWIDFGPEGMIATRMPFNYVLEMFCDRVAASMIYQKEKYRDDSALKYYEHGINHMLIHTESQKELEFLLHYLADNGLKKTIIKAQGLLKEYREKGIVTLS